MHPVPANGAAMASLPATIPAWQTGRPVTRPTASPGFDRIAEVADIYPSQSDADRLRHTRGPGFKVLV